MKNLKIREISFSGQKQGENSKIGKLRGKSGRLSSYAPGTEGYLERGFQHNKSVNQTIILKTAATFLQRHTPCAFRVTKH